MNALNGVIFDIGTPNMKILRELKKCDKEYIKKLDLPMLPFQWHKKITEK